MRHGVLVFSSVLVLLAGSCSRYVPLLEPGDGRMEDGEDGGVYDDDGSDDWSDEVIWGDEHEPDGGSEADADSGGDTGPGPEGGELSWIVRIGGMERDRRFAVAAAPDGSAFITGAYDGEAVFGPGDANQTVLDAGVFDYLYVARYHPDGTLAWVRRAEGDEGTSQGRDVVALADGSVVVTGEFGGTVVLGQGEAHQTELSPLGLGDVIVARYNADGSLAWARQAGGPERDQGWSVAAAADGSVVVAGMFQGAAVFGPGEINETSLSSSGAGDAFLARYSADGSLDWAVKAGGARHDAGFCVDVLDDGTSYLAGSFRGTAVFGRGDSNQTTLEALAEDDIFVAKYDPDGHLLWARSFGGEGHDGVKGIEKLPGGSLLVAGHFDETITFGMGETNETRFTSAGMRDAYVARFDPDGTVAWAFSEGGPQIDTAMDIASLTDGSFLLAGRFMDTVVLGSGGGEGITLEADWDGNSFLARYQPNGSVSWAKTLQGWYWRPEWGIDAFADGSSLLTGIFRSSIYFGKDEPNETRLAAVDQKSSELFLARHDADGALAWAVQAGGGPTTWDGMTMDFASDIHAFSDGTSLVAGLFMGSANFGMGEAGEVTLTASGWCDCYIVKYSPEGRVIFARQAGASGGYVTGQGLTGFEDGSFLVTGGFKRAITFGRGEAGQTNLFSAGGWDVFFAKFNPDGEVEWARRAGGAEDDWGDAVSQLDGRSVYLAGVYRLTSVFGPGEAGETYLTAANNPDNPDYPYPDAFVARYDADGRLTWVRDIKGVDFDRPFGIIPLPDGSSLVTGFITFGAAFGYGEPNDPNFFVLRSEGWEDAFFARFNPDGTIDWAKNAGGERGDVSHGMVLLEDGSFLSTGRASQWATFGKDEENETTLFNDYFWGASYMYVARYNPDGTLSWVRSATGEEYACGTDIAALPDGSSLVIGSYRYSVTFGKDEPNETTLPVIGDRYNTNIFVAHYDPDGNLIWVRYAGGSDDADEGQAIGVLDDGSIFAVGTVRGKATFGAGEPGETSLRAAGHQDGFVMRLNP